MSVGPMLMLEAPPASWTGVAMVYASPAAPGSKVVENAGRAVMEHLNRLSPSSSPVTSKNSSPNRKTKVKLALRKFRKSDLKDYYKLLHLEHLGVMAAEEDIRKSYRTVSMMYHPDKHAGKGIEHAENVYKAIQTAHTHLSDVKKRRAYDSTLPFDDSIPPAKLGRGEDFFEVFGEVFKRNSQFSLVQPVPEFGDANTDLDQIDGLYDFWYSFKSWRDFEIDDFHNPDNADGREERRWMERKNEKQKAAKRKAESTRLRTLVDRAFKLDPRIKALRELEKERRKQKRRDKKMSKFQERGSQKKEVTGKKAATKAKAAEAVPVVKNVAKKGKALALDEFKSVFLAHPFADDFICADYVYQEMSSRSIDDIRSTSALIASSDLNSILRLFGLDEIPGGENMLPSGSSAAQPSPAAAESATVALPSGSPVSVEHDTSTEVKAPKQEPDVHAEVPWTLNELSLLAKAVSRFVGGTPGRWRRIAEFVGTRSEADCIAKAKSVNKAAKEDTGALAFDQYQRSSKGKKEKTKEKMLKGDANQAFEEPHQAVAVESADEWSDAQHLAFEGALRSVDKGDPERWLRIAELVDGKSKQQCIRWYKKIRDDIRQKKKAQA